MFPIAIGIKYTPKWVNAKWSIGHTYSITAICRARVTRISFLRSPCITVSAGQKGRSFVALACAKACPTNAIQFGEVSELQERAKKRVENLHTVGVKDAYLYGVPDSPGATGGIESLNAFFLLLDRPEVYNLPAAPTLPQSRTPRGLLNGALTMAVLGLAAAATFFWGRHRG